jgi:hypothetical protein
MIDRVFAWLGRPLANPYPPWWTILEDSITSL